MSSPVSERPGSAGSESGSSMSGGSDPGSVQSLGTLGMEFTRDPSEQSYFVRAVTAYGADRVHENLGEEAHNPDYNWQIEVDLRHWVTPEIVDLQDGRVAGFGRISYYWIATRVPVVHDGDDHKKPCNRNGEIGISLPVVDHNNSERESSHLENGVSLTDYVARVGGDNVSFPGFITANGSVDRVDDDDDDQVSLPSFILDGLDDDNDDQVSLPSMILDGFDDDNDDQVSLPSMILDGLDDDENRVVHPDSSSNTDSNNNGVSISDVSSSTETDNNGVSLHDFSSNPAAHIIGSSLTHDDTSNSSDETHDLGLNQINCGDGSGSDENNEGNDGDDENDSNHRRTVRPSPILTTHHRFSTASLPHGSSILALFVLGTPTTCSDVASPRTPLSPITEVSNPFAGLDGMHRSPPHSPFLHRSSSRSSFEHPQEQRKDHVVDIELKDCAKVRVRCPHPIDIEIAS